MEELVYLGDSLRYFINHFQINIVQGHTIINLLDYLPLLKLGYTYRRTFINLLEYLKEFDQVQFNQVAEIAFDSDIPVEFFIVIDKDNKMTMEKALREMYADKIQNTYQRLSQFRDDGKYDITELVDYNSYYGYEDNLLNEYSKDKKLLMRLRYEFDFILDLFVLFEDQILKHNDTVLKTIINGLMDENTGAKIIYRRLSDDERIKLYVAIIEKDLHKVKSYLLTIDPRLDDNQAYVLAVEIGDNKIIAAIKDKIVKDNWYEKEVYLSNIGNVGADISKHNKK